jgi:periplasmic protein TonB
VDKNKKQRLYRHVPLVVGALIVALASGLLFWFVSGMLEKKAEGPKRQTTQVVKLIRPPPPPEQPPPPPPPPEKTDEPIPKDTPEPAPQDNAPAEQLGVDADGSAGGDGFGLAARKGGRDLLASGNGAFAWYTGMLKDSILEKLSEDGRVRRGSYAAIVRIWVASDGRVERVKLAQSTGDRARDTAIEESLTKLSHVREAPPLEMPQPITLRIVSRG